MAESIIKHYYDALKEGKLAGKKCGDCGKISFPPTTACSHCGCFNQSWMELSGKGRMMYVSHSMAPPPNPRFNGIAPYAYGHILLEEGVWIQAVVTGVAIDPENLRACYEKGETAVIKDIQELGDLHILAFTPV
ncbi:MAG: zinc ribbon domain-containing protein [Spirochaetota bacterium]